MHSHALVGNPRCTPAFRAPTSAQDCLVECDGNAPCRRAPFVEPTPTMHTSALETPMPPSLPRRIHMRRGRVPQVSWGYTYHQGGMHGRTQSPDEDRAR
ncbi:hypothetical protein HMPREF1316_1106 [Olsenella profusa F0195]|uniref:Uncharacterized protein n=1 Tax=Olsenella profusa F0195 TaxID=1125712 RepID=U2V5K6_9ACTN|nr:hypothetical protein HMPREF1316_1106 [Olsenella profusa F0195]